jgi:hypothetical protein
MQLGYIRVKWNRKVIKISDLRPHIQIPTRVHSYFDTMYSYLMLKRPVYSFTSLVIYLYAHANDTVKFELCMYDTFLHRKEH